MNAELRQEVERTLLETGVDRADLQAAADATIELALAANMESEPAAKAVGEALLFGAEPTSAALISDDGRYRYWLSRTWGTGGWHATFVMLNPSTADASVDDPTIRRCTGFAKAWGCDGLYVVNLYALRSTDPKGLWLAEDPVGPQNDHWLTEFAQMSHDVSGPLVASWGANAKPERVAHVLRLPGMDRLTALGVTKDGAPRHPLYLRSDSIRMPWSMP